VIKSLQEENAALRKKNIELMTEVDKLKKEVLEVKEKREVLLKQNINLQRGMDEQKKENIMLRNASSSTSANGDVGGTNVPEVQRKDQLENDGCRSINTTVAKPNASADKMHESCEEKKNNTSKNTPGLSNSCPSLVSELTTHCKKQNAKLKVKSEAKEDLKPSAKPRVRKTSKSKVSEKLPVTQFGTNTTFSKRQTSLRDKASMFESGNAKGTKGTRPRKKRVKKKKKKTGKLALKFANMPVMGVGKPPTLGRPRSRTTPGQERVRIEDDEKEKSVDTNQMIKTRPTISHKRRTRSRRNLKSESVLEMKETVSE